MVYKLFSHKSSNTPVNISQPQKYQDVFKDEPNYAKVKQPTAVEIDIKKNLKIDNADTISLKSDEVIKGKVKTKKDQLRALRNG